jgi:hypothetical protein
LGLQGRLRGSDRAPGGQADLAPAPGASGG